MANYANAFLGDYGTRNTQAPQIIANAMQNRTTNALAADQNARANDQNARANQQFEIAKDDRLIELMKVPYQMTQIKSSTISQMAGQIKAMPRDQRVNQYNRMVNEVAPKPVGTHKDLGPLGTLDPNSFIKPDEFSKMDDKAQKDYLDVIQYTGKEMAEIDMADRNAAARVKEIEAETTNKLKEIRARESADISVENTRFKNDLSLEKEKGRQNRLTEGIKQEGRKNMLSDVQSIFSDDEAEMYASMYLLQGKLPSLGRGKEATAARQQILKAATKIAKDMGLTTGDIVTGQADVKAIGSSLTQQEKQYGSMGSFVRNLQGQVEKVKLLSEDLKMFDTRLLNVPLRALRQKMAGSALQSKYEMYLTEIESEIGKLATGSTASVAELSASAQERWAKIHDKNLSVNDMLDLLEETQAAGEMRMKSVEAQIALTRERLKKVNTGGADRTVTGDIDAIRARIEANRANRQ